MRAHIAILSAAIALGLAGNAQAREIPAADALVKFHEIEGKPVTLKNCAIVHAARDFVACSVPGGGAITVVLDSETLSAADRRMASRNCQGSSPSTRCDADVTGIPTRIGSHIVMTDADIHWAHAAEKRLVHDAAAIPSGQHLAEGSQVLISNCMIAGANREFLSCTASGSPAGPHVLIDVDHLAKADIRRANRHCVGWSGSSACEADVAGKVTAIGSYYKLERPGIFWKEADIALD